MDEERQAPRGLRIGGLVALVLVVGALALTVGIGVVRSAVSGAAGEPVPVAAVTPAPTPSPYVYVTGAVAAPGLVQLPSGARIADAIAAAGGFAVDADQSAVNLARVVLDGEQVHVPLVGEAAPPAGTPGGGLVSINLATASELEVLPRIGPTLAARIVQWRDDHGPFGSVDALLDVPGIGDALLEGLRDLVTL